MHRPAQCRTELAPAMHAWRVPLSISGVCSPDGMIRSVQNCPSASMLADLKDCLDFCSNSWVSLFCRQGGIALLLQVMHMSGSLVLMRALLPHGRHQA